MQPHKNEYWLFPKIADWDAFVVRVALICQLILGAISFSIKNRHVVSVDEKTGIQALERIEEKASVSKGGHTRQEFEYTRHGPTGLIAAYDVAKGDISNYYLNKNRKEKDFLAFIKRTLAQYPKEDDVVIIADQLNTHLSASLVEYIAQIIAYEGDLGVKGREGILKSMVSRKAFLETHSHRVRFIYTPKHCSWLNPVENWFAKLERHVIKNGVFTSVDDLKDKIRTYIKYYNECLVKPLNWKFKGFNKNKKLANYKVSKT